jgi:hypothetical protein
MLFIVGSLPWRLVAPVDSSRIESIQRAITTDGVSSFAVAARMVE